MGLDRKFGFRVTDSKRQARILGERKLDRLTMDLLAEEFPVAPFD